MATEALWYTASHEWCRIEGGIATVGVTEHAQAQLGDIVFVELPQVGDALCGGEDVAVLESVKTAADIYAPVDGKVVAINDALSSEPGLINRSAMSDGWLYRCEVAALPDGLLDADAYQALVTAE